MQCALDFRDKEMGPMGMNKGPGPDVGILGWVEQKSSDMLCKLVPAHPTSLKLCSEPFYSSFGKVWFSGRKRDCEISAILNKKIVVLFLFQSNRLLSPSPFNKVMVFSSS